MLLCLHLLILRRTPAHLHHLHQKMNFFVLPQSQRDLVLFTEFLVVPLPVVLDFCFGQLLDLLDPFLQSSFLLQFAIGMTGFEV